MQPSIFREQHGPVQIRKWFDAADRDHSGRLSIDEFFRWTVGNAVFKHGAGSLKAAFERYDKDKTGEIDALEFGKLCADMGFGAVSHELFRQLDQDQSGAIVYTELLDWVQDAKDSAFSKQLLTSLAWSCDEAKKVDKQKMDTSGWVLRGQSAKEIRDELRGFLSSSGKQVADLLMLFNEEGGSAKLLIDESKFHVTLRRLGYKGLPQVLDECFAALDADGSGSVGFDELFEFVRGYRHSLDPRSKVVNGLRFRPPHPATSLVEVQWDVEALRMMIRDTLARAKLGASDVMKAWDKSGDLALNRSEWVSNVRALFRTSEARLWEDEVLAVVSQSFQEVQYGGDVRSTEISIQELERWLAPKPKLQHIRLKTRRSPRGGGKGGETEQTPSLSARADQAIEAGKRRAAARQAAVHASEREKLTRWKQTRQMHPNGQKWELPPVQRWEMPRAITPRDFDVGHTRSSPMNATTLSRLGSPDQTLFGPTSVTPRTQTQTPRHGRSMIMASPRVAMGSSGRRLHELREAGRSGTPALYSSILSVRL
jgi:Ca2+-binding EF-hand superfamily protein